MDEVIELRVNCADAEEAAGIAAAVVNRRLAAAANVAQPVTSSYWWQGEVVTREEVPVLMRSRLKLFGDLAALITRLHSYDTPGITALTVSAVSPAYRAWVFEQTSGD